MKVTCPTCNQSTEIIYRREYDDYMMKQHYTNTHIICATSGTVYPKEIVKIVFKR